MERLIIQIRNAMGNAGFRDAADNFRNRAYGAAGNHSDGPFSERKLEYIARAWGIK